MNNHASIVFGTVLALFGVLFLIFLSRTLSFTTNNCMNLKKHRVLLIVLDSLRYDYLDVAKSRNISLPNLNRMVTTGARVHKVIPVYPSVTMPNHQTMLTGLYSPYHGITHNDFNDSSMGYDQFSMDNQSSLNEARWYKGYPDPIWVTCEKNRYCKSGSMLFPHTDAAIDGYRPYRYVSQYIWLNLAPQSVYPYDRRVDELIDWMKNDLIDFGLLYFDEPDITSHVNGPLHSKTLAKLTEMDGYIGRLIEGLEKEDLLRTTDILVTGDHGMTEMSRDRIIQIDDFVNKDWYKSTYSYPVGIIYPEEGKFDDVFRAYNNASSHIKVYKREDLPKDLYYTDNPSRISPIVTVVDLGWFVNCSHYNKTFYNGYHGFSPYEDDMKTMLLAMGPSFQNIAINQTRHVDLYTLMIHLLGLTANSNNGSFARISPLLNKDAMEWKPVGSKINHNVVVILVFLMVLIQIIIAAVYVVALLMKVCNQHSGQGNFGVNYRKEDYS